jgi:hypothetical protein
MTCRAGHRWRVEDIALAASRALEEATEPLPLDLTNTTLVPFSPRSQSTTPERLGAWS